jgi:capsular polysaccharide biosynthesis protein
MSSDDAVRLSLVALVLRRRWRLLAALAAVGALLGVGASLLLSPGYQTTSYVLLQGPREPDELLTEAQVAVSSVVLDRAAATLGWNVTGAELQQSVTAEAGAGNVIAIAATAETPEQAKQLADQVAQDYVAFATQLLSNSPDASAQALREQRELLRQQIVATNDRIKELHASTSQGGLTVESVQARTELEGLRITLGQAITKLDEADDAASQANIVVMGQAELPSDPAAPTMTHFIIGTALLLAVLGVLAHLIAARTDRRLRNESEIGSALGAPVLGSIDVLDPPAEEYPTTHRPWWSQLWRLVLHDENWNAPQLQVADDDASREIRCRRVLSRLQAGSRGPVRLFVLATDDDATAGRAIRQLLATANTVNAANAVHTANPERLMTLRAIGVFAGHPTVPDDGGVSGVLVLVTAGTRTAWELFGIAEACADAGHRIIGVVVTYRARSTTPAEPSPSSPSRVAVGGG